MKTEQFANARVLELKKHYVVQLHTQLEALINQQIELKCNPKENAEFKEVAGSLLKAVVDKSLEMQTDYEKQFAKL